jgi:voltage-gated potassium channel
LNIISRATHQTAVDKLKLAGANHVVIPDAIGGAHMAALVNNPDVIEFMDAIKVQGQSGVNIESISFDELPTTYRNKSIGELELKKNSGATIIGFRTPEGDYIINPDDGMKLVEKSQLFVLGSAEQINRLNILFGINL